MTAARTTSETFSGRVREIRKEQAIVQLEALPPQHIEVEAQEREPNDDVLTTNVVKLGAWITGAIGHPRDDDFYTFTLPDGPRDIFRVELENRSTTLEPELHHYDSRKSHTRGLSNGTAGADLSYEFVAEPGSRHHLQVRNDDRATTGAYLLRIAPRNAYDAFEPNDTVLQAKPIRTGEAVMAGVMDGLDDDYFVIETGTDGGNLSIALYQPALSETHCRLASATARPSHCEESLRGD